MNLDVIYADTLTRAKLFIFLRTLGLKLDIRVPLVDSFDVIVTQDAIDETSYADIVEE